MTEAEATIRLARRRLRQLEKQLVDLEQRRAAGERIAAEFEELADEHRCIDYLIELAEGAKP